MVGFGRAADRLTQVQEWVTEHAASLGLPVSAGLLCETAVARLGLGGAALTMNNTQGWPETMHATGLRSERLEELQVTVGEGPCVDAYRAGGPIFVADLDSPAVQRRWPLFAPLAVEAGASALFVLPLCVGAVRIGILALHHVEHRRFEPATLTDSVAFASLALRLLLDEQAGPRTRGLEDRTDTLSLHSPQVHQATGMIAAQLDVSMEDAFARLRARAFTDHRPLADLAADVVAQRLRIDHAGEAT